MSKKGKRKLTKEEKAILHREAILEAARGLFIRKGYYATTVDEIAETMGATKGAVYHYVQGKDEILFLLHDRGMTRLIDNLQSILDGDAPIEIKLRQAIRLHVLGVCDEASMAIATDRPEWALPERQREAVLAKRKQYQTLFESLIRQGMEDGFLRPLDAKLVGFAMVGALNWIPQWYDNRGRLSREEIADVMAEYLIHGLLGGGSGVPAGDGLVAEK